MRVSCERSLVWWMECDSIVEMQDPDLSIRIYLEFVRAKATRCCHITLFTLMYTCNATLRCNCNERRILNFTGVLLFGWPEISLANRSDGRPYATTRDTTTRSSLPLPLCCMTGRWSGSLVLSFVARLWSGLEIDRKSIKCEGVVTWT